MKYIIKLGLVLILSSCNQEKINTLETEIIELKTKIEFKNATIKRQKEELDKNKIIKKYSESEIIQIFKKDRNYYCPNAKRKDFKLRQVDANIFDIRFLRMTTDKYRIPKIWEITVYRLELLPGDKYNLRWRQGPMCL